MDVWAYYNHADEVELFLNGQSLGSKSKQGDELYVMWRIPVSYTHLGERRAIRVATSKSLEGPYSIIEGHLNGCLLYTSLFCLCFQDLPSDKRQA